MTVLGFSKIRSNIVDAIKKSIEEKKLTPSVLAASLESFYGKPIISVEKVYDILSNNTLPSIYQLYKICAYLQLSVDKMFEHGISSSAQPATINTPTRSITTLSLETKSMKTTNTIAISKTMRKNYRKVVTAHTTSTKYNLLLAHAIYNSGMQLQDVAKKAGCSTRSLRDYALYGMSVNSDVVTALTKMFKTTARNLGLVQNKDTGRYDHLKVTVKA